MTFLSLLQLCQRLSGNKTSDASLGFKDFLNLGQKEIAGAFPRWPELQSTATLTLTDGDEDYDLANDFWKMRKIVITTDNYERELLEINYQDFRTRHPNTSDDSKSEPIYWYFDPSDNDDIRVYPIPDRSYTVSYDYIVVPSDMSADSDTPFFASRYHHILVDFALAMYYESAYEARFDKAGYYRQKFQEKLAELISDASNRSLRPGSLQFSYATGVNEG